MPTLLTKEQIVEDRFWNRVDKKGDDECWVWKGPLIYSGYGRLWIPSKGFMIPVHRISYALANGKADAGLTIDHLCRNRGCVNPKHLEQVSNRTNVLRGISIMAQQAKKTDCPQGHPLSGGNLRVNHLRRGRRCCSICDRESSRRYKGWKRAEKGLEIPA